MRKSANAKTQEKTLGFSLWPNRTISLPLCSALLAVNQPHGTTATASIAGHRRRPFFLRLNRWSPPPSLLSPPPSSVTELDLIQSAESHLGESTAELDLISSGSHLNSHHSHRLHLNRKFVADFYISDFQSGLRALVKAGYGAKVAPFVKPTKVADITKENRELSPSFLRWLADRSLSSDDRVMRLKEGYIKEGSTVSVMGVVRRHDNVLMIVPPSDPVSTGCQWARCLLPTYVEGLILTCDESQNADVIPV